MSKSFDGVSETTTPFAPAISANYLDAAGIPVFMNALTNEPYGFDPWDLKRQGRIGSTVLGMMGKKGHGKTSTNIVLGGRLSNRQVNGRQLRIGLDDHRTNNGVPEYQRFCAMHNSREITLRNYRLNLLDMSLGFTYAEQLNIVKESLEFAIRRVMVVAEAEALRYGLKKVRKLFPETAELGLLALCLRTLTTEEIAIYQSELVTDLESRHANDANFQMLQYAQKTQTRGLLPAASNLASAIEELLDGPFGTIYGGNHSLAGALQQPVVALDYNGLIPDAVTLIQSLMWDIKSSAILRTDHRFYTDIEFHDENYSQWRNKVYARSMSNYMKRIRATSAFLVMNTHRWADYRTVGDESSEEYKLASNMLEDIDMWLLGQMTRPAANETRERLGLSKRERDLLLGLPVGSWLLKIGDEPLLEVRTNLTALEREQTASDAANDEMAVEGTDQIGAKPWAKNGSKHLDAGSSLAPAAW